MNELMVEILFAAWVLLTSVGAVVSLAVFARGLAAARRSRGRPFIRGAVLLSATAICVLANPIGNFMILGKPYEVSVGRMQAFRGGAGELTEIYGAPASKWSRNGREYWRYHPRPWYILLPLATVTLELEDQQVVASTFDW